MMLSYNTSRIVELLVQNAWGTYDRWYLFGAIDADKFMGHPRHAVDLLLAPYVLRKPFSHNDSTIAGYVNNLSNLCSCENDTNADKDFLDLFRELASYLEEKYA